MSSPKKVSFNDFEKYKPKRFLPTPEFKCKSCQDVGWISTTAGISPCQCTMRTIKARHFGQNYAEKTIGNYEARSYTAGAAKRILEREPAASYLLTGGVGLGKTHLLAGLFEALYLPTSGAILVKKELDLLEYLGKGVGWLENFKDREYKVVQIDDFGKVNLASWDIDKFFRFYDHISANRILLQVTTNLSPEAIGRTYGAAITDRLFRNNKCEILHLRDDVAVPGDKPEGGDQ